MNLYHALRLLPADCVTFSGAGGKTTAIFQLAREIQALYGNQDLGVIVTTTTHLQVDQASLANSHLCCTLEEPLADQLNSLKGVVLVTGPLEGDRATGVSPLVLSRLHEICLEKNIHLLVEADGSRMLPLKSSCRS